MKNFVKAMDRKGSGLAFLQEKFPKINMEKLKTGILEGLQIREFIKNSMFDKALNEAKLSAWQPLKSVVTKFMENHRSAEYEKEIEAQPRSFCQLHFLSSHLDY